MVGRCVVGSMVIGVVFPSDEVSTLFLRSIIQPSRKSIPTRTGRLALVSRISRSKVLFATVKEVLDDDVSDPPTPLTADTGAGAGGGKKFLCFFNSPWVIKLFVAPQSTTVGGGFELVVLP